MAKKLTTTQRRALHTLSLFSSSAEVALEMDGPDFARVANADRCVEALIRRGLVARNEHGDPELTEAGRAALVVVPR
jgi:hypothetical protein